MNPKDYNPYVKVVDEYEDKEEVESEENAFEEDDAEFSEEEIDDLPVIVGLSSGEKFIADFAEGVEVENCIVFYRPLRIIELVDNSETQLRFAMFNPFLYDNILPIQTNHIVFLTAISKEGFDIYQEFCKELEEEEYKAYKLKQRQKRQKKTPGGNVVKLPFVERKPPETE